MATRVGSGADAGFTGLTFLHLLFGYRTVDEVKHICRDTTPFTVDGRVLLGALFPKRPSTI